MARAYDNGVYRDMTAAEIAELEAMRAELPEARPSDAERLAELEEALALLLSGEVE